jgi:putative restriction endonuclease
MWRQMTRIPASELRERFRNIVTWKRGGQRAPHKPLLLLLALGKIVRGEPRLIRFREVDQELGRLLREFGPSRKSVHPEYPFWRLQHDEVWELPNAERFVPRTGHTDAKKSQLIRHDATAGFTQSIFDMLRKNTRLLGELVSEILEAHFPSSYHDELLQVVGLDAARIAVHKARDPAFKHIVLEAYEYQCAICGYDAQLRSCPLGLDAAHIRWFAFGGPDTPDNGLALCAVHHRAFDRGAIGLTNALEIVVSAGVHGGDCIDNWFKAFNGARLRRPYSESMIPRRQHIAWHRREVFREPPRGRGVSSE